MTDIIAQCWLTLFSVSAVGASQARGANVRRYACILGCLSQPAWFYTTWTHGQWGIFALCFVYASLWANGVWNFWIRPKFLEERNKE
jgi:hypothetical protein